MPIFEYVCSECDHRFEALVRGGEAPRCPACAGDRLQKQLSVFAVGAKSAAAPSPGPCGACGDPRGPGACSMN
jgi:putative FmdB family regulatory protein